MTENGQKLVIYTMVFINNTLTISTEDREDFWLEISPAIGWVLFQKLRNETEFSATGALFVATELRPVSDSAPYPIVEARCVLWRQREALLSAANTLSFLLGQERSGQ